MGVRIRERQDILPESLKNLLLNCIIIISLTLISFKLEVIKNLVTFSVHHPVFITDNELIINLKKGKTEAMLFSTTKKLNKANTLELSYGETPINTTNCYKYLGISIDPELRLNDHFERTVKKSISRLKLLSLIRPSVTSFVAFQIFRTMVQSIIIYGSSTNLNLNRTNIEHIDSIDRRARKIVNKREVARNLIEPTTNVIKRKACCLVKKCLLGKTNVLMSDYFEIINHQQNTRNRNALIRLPRIRLEVARSGFFFMGGKLYNTLPVELRSLENLKSFKNKIRSHIF